MTNPPGVTGCKEIDVGIKTLDECKRRCLSHSVQGEECVLVFFLRDDDPAVRDGPCELIIKVETPEAFLNVCMLENDEYVSARCTGGDLSFKMYYFLHKFSS